MDYHLLYVKTVLYSKCIFLSFPTILCESMWTLSIIDFNLSIGEEMYVLP